MMELLKGWISTLCIAVVFVSIAHIILPNSSIKKHAKFTFSLIILAIMISPIIKLLNLNENIENSTFKESMAYEFKKENEDVSLYDEEIIMAGIKDNLVTALKDEFYENDFVVSLEGNIDLKGMNVDIKGVEVRVLDNKKVEKVKKIVIGEEKIQKEENKDSFLKKVEKFVEKELEISHEHIYVSYD